MDTRHGRERVNRREFMAQAGLCTAVVTAAAGAADGKEEPKPAAEALPTVQLGKRTVTRMITGFNPIGGFSHATSNLSTHMREYFTVERTVEFLKHAEELGINTFQFDPIEKVEKALDILWATDTKLQYLCLTSERPGAPSLERVMKYKPFAVSHHGGVTDFLFRAGKAGEVRDFVKKVHDAGAMACVSTHNPENLKRMADEGWETDFFMACLHNLTRTREEMEKDLGHIPFGEPFVESDPPLMAAVVRQVDKPCLAFKILAAGRRCDTQNSVGAAFRWAFENIKPTDAVIVGMFPQYQDELAINADFTRKYGQA